MKKMIALNEAELSTVSGARKHRKPSVSVKKIGDVYQQNSFDVTQVIADADVYGNLSMTAYAEQSNSNTGSIS
jgi:hypothetical protein